MSISAMINRLKNFTRSLSHRKCCQGRVLGFVLFTLSALIATKNFAEEQTEANGLDFGRTFTGTVPTASGILPQLGILLKLPDRYQLRDPDQVSAPAEPIPYTRKYPLGAQKVVNQGYSLPLPFGVSVIGVDNTQLQTLDNLAVALGKGIAPAPGTPLVDLPFVALENVVSSTRSKQVKVDMWVLPFLNLFASLGKVDGKANLDVVVDLDAAFPPPICTPISPCGTVSANFDAGVDAVTTTVGANAVYSFGYWWVNGNLSTTLTMGSNTDTDVKSYTAAVRLGRRFQFGKGNIVSPYFGASYLDVNTTVEGVTGLRNAFPDGDDLYVRYRVDQENTHKLSAVVGLNFGFKNGTSVQAEYNYSEGGERFVLSASYRF